MCPRDDFSTSIIDACDMIKSEIRTLKTGMYEVDDSVSSAAAEMQRCE